MLDVSFRRGVSVKIAIDAFGGDNAPSAVIGGCAAALEKFDDISLIITGDEKIIKSELSAYCINTSRIQIVNAPERIMMDEPPVQAIKQKPNSSMVAAFNKIVGGEADAFVSAGNTGAILTGATLLVRRIEGILRPALGVVFPTVKNTSTLMLDCGANVDCKAAYLCQFAIMGSVYMERVMGYAAPRVGLINNGTEAEKGNALTKETYKLLTETNINFKGNAEGRELLSGDYDVLVCDGFDGNLILKHTEGMVSAMTKMLKAEYMLTKRAKLGALMSRKALANFKRRLDYTEHGGAPLLGVNGCVIKAHGSSNAKAFTAAIGQARDYILGGVTNHIKTGIENITQ